MRGATPGPGGAAESHPRSTADAIQSRFVPNTCRRRAVGADAGGAFFILALVLSLVLVKTLRRRGNVKLLSYQVCSFYSSIINDFIFDLHDNKTDI